MPGWLFPSTPLINVQRPLEEMTSFGYCRTWLKEEGQVIQALRDERMIGAGDPFRLLKQFACNGNSSLKFSSRVQPAGFFGELLETGARCLVRTKSKRRKTEDRKDNNDAEDSSWTIHYK